MKHHYSIIALSQRVFSFPCTEQFDKLQSTAALKTGSQMHPGVL